jgi:4-aminobutyrate aminotransferase-like enzyme
MSYLQDKIESNLKKALRKAEKNYANIDTAIRINLKDNCGKEYIDMYFVFNSMESGCEKIHKFTDLISTFDKMFFGTFGNLNSRANEYVCLAINSICKKYNIDKKECFFDVYEMYCNEEKTETKLMADLFHYGINIATMDANKIISISSEKE